MINKLLILSLMTNFTISCSTNKIIKPNKIETPVVKIIGDVFTTGSSLSKVQKSVACANAVIIDNDFAAELSLKKDFNETVDNGETVLKKLLSHNAVIKTYSKRFTKAAAFTNSKKSLTDIWLNTKKRSSYSYLVGTYIHELSHLLNYHHYGKGNQRKGNENSVPYFLTELGKKYAKLVCGL